MQRGDYGRVARSFPLGKRKPGLGPRARRTITRFRTLTAPHVAVTSVSTSRAREGGTPRSDQIAVLSGEDGDWAAPFEGSPALNLSPETATDAPATSTAPDAPLLECYAAALEFAAMRLVSLPGSRGRDYATKMQRVA